MSRAIQLIMPLGIVLLAGCGKAEGEETPSPAQPTVTDFEVATCGDYEGPELEPPISDEELAALKRAYEEGEDTPRPADRPTETAEASAEGTDVERC